MGAEVGRKKMNSPKEWEMGPKDWVFPVISEFNSFLPGCQHTLGDEVFSEHQLGATTILYS